MDLKGTGSYGVDWIYMVEDRGKWRALANTVTYVRVVQNAGNSNGCGTVSFPRRTVIHGVK